VIAWKARLLNDLVCVEWGVKLLIHLRHSMLLCFGVYCKHTLKWLSNI